MREWFKPLFVYRKYINAKRVLKFICRPQIDLTKGRADNVFIIGFNKMNLAFILSELPDHIDPLRLSQAVDLLAENGHIQKFENQDWLLYEIVCTKKGEIALEEGFYNLAVLKFIAIIVTSSGVLILLRLIARWSGLWK